MYSQYSCASRGVGVDDGDLARLGQTLIAVFDHSLVNALFDDFVAHVIRAIDVKAFFIQAEAHGQRRLLQKNEDGQVPKEL